VWWFECPKIVGVDGAGTWGGQISVFEWILVVVWWSSWLWWLDEVVGDGDGSGAGAAHISDCTGVILSSKDGVGVVHNDAAGVVVVAIFAVDGGPFEANPAQKSSP